MNEETIKKNYEVAKERYAAFGVDTDKAIATLEQTPISLHCWQADDVVGFERNDALSGGIMTTGNFPGRARNIDELRQDVEGAVDACRYASALTLRDLRRLWRQICRPRPGGAKALRELDAVG